MSCSGDEMMPRKESASHHGAGGGDYQQYMDYSKYTQNHGSQGGDYSKYMQGQGSQARRSSKKWVLNVTG